MLKPSAYAGLLLLILLLSVGDFASGEIYFEKGSPHVKLSNDALLSGKIDYSREGRPFNSFLGVPFGSVPERFQDPQPLPPWEGVFSAVKPGEMCVQPYPDPKTGKLAKVGEEDCLNLNVHVPMNNTQKEGGLPVMVWIFGGGFSSGNNEYGPSYFTDEDVILVTVNYRVGAFGFLSTGDSVIPGNSGMKDQVLALRWVQDHIENFGGDPKKVTVFGESAGGAAVHYLVLSPTTEGLFQGAISQSGSALAPWAYYPNPKVTAALLANHLNCPTSAKEPSEISSEEIATCLMGVSVEKLNEAQAMFAPRWPAASMPFAFGPVKEPKAAAGSSKTPFLTESPWTLVLSDSTPHKKIPYMIGVTKDEGVSQALPLLAQLDQDLLKDLNTKFADSLLRAIELDKFTPNPEQKKVVGEKIRKFYFGDKEISTETSSKDALIDIYTDADFLYAVRKAALETASKGKQNPVYLYQYAHVSPNSLIGLMGLPVSEADKQKVGHGEDLLFQFNLENVLPAAVDQIKPDTEHDEFSKNFIKLWVSFAVNGKPTHSWGNSKEEWKPISKDEVEGKTSLKWYRLTSNPGYIKEDFTERAMFWEKMHEELYLQSD